MRLPGLLALIVLLPFSTHAQQPVTLREVAEATRGRWQAQDAAGLVARSPQLLIQLPGADPSAPVQRRQAVELLRDFFSRAVEVETRITDAREMGDGWGFVELNRRYRIQGTQEVRQELLLLSYRQSGGSWVLVELRVGSNASNTDNR